MKDVRVLKAEVSNCGCCPYFHTEYDGAYCANGVYSDSQSWCDFILDAVYEKEVFFECQLPKRGKRG